jgi:hypothetical protein
MLDEPEAAEPEAVYCTSSSSRASSSVASYRGTSVVPLLLPLLLSDDPASADLALW